MKKAKLYQRLPDKKVKCTACSWYCVIGVGRFGLCGTRTNVNGILYSLVYGMAVGLVLDPVEKKPLYHFLPGGSLLSFGTVGCNFGCEFCQNWEQSQLVKTLESLDARQDFVKRMSKRASPKDIVELALKYKANGIAYTYNEPAIFAEYAYDTAFLAKKKGLKNVYVSNGFESLEQINYMRGLIDAINIDLKSAKDDFYLKLCHSRADPVKSNIKRFFDAGVEVEVTTLVIPGFNDSESELVEIAEFLKNISSDIPWHISAFHPSYKMTRVPRTSKTILDKAYQIGKSLGLRHVYEGNVCDDERTKTFCPNCGTVLISRKDYVGRVVNLDLKHGVCLNCRERIYGIWSQ